MSNENDREKDEADAAADLVDEVERESPVPQDGPEKSQGDKLEKRGDS